MAKEIIIDVLNNITEINEIPDIQIIETDIQNEPTLEERVKATEDAILALLDMGV